MISRNQYLKTFDRSNTGKKMDLIVYSFPPGASISMQNECKTLLF